ncbi:uncharacterized protein PAC_11682 [Phialocephala subalpina]|uniref:Alpha-L-rhamnosidase six-hairpin glycosidase domain-containing protein n=1 Tax=Phialocephala subalpina TaxID=576137 RepID=A0A1L7X9S9_9HELO|nr:uncharacterized protein PAC_11682 [Phialocephala subalpina]
MATTLSFTSPATFLDSKNQKRSPQYEVPQYILPVRVHSYTGSVKSAEHLVARPHEPCQYDAHHSCTFEQPRAQHEQSSVILDFGVAVAGIPVIEVSSIEKDPSLSTVLLDISYSEGFPGIERPGGDGPYPFSAGADTLRRNRFRIRGVGFYESKHVQGSQRWMRITLVSPEPCSISISMVGFKPTTMNTPLEELPGLFECSDPGLTSLWQYGARTLQLNSIPARTVPPPWQLSEDMGILIDSQRCNAYGWGGHWTDYAVEVEGMVIEGGFSWNVRVAGGRPGLLFVLNVASGSNPANLELWYGYYNKPQITLVPILLSRQDITGIDIIPGEWYKIKTVCCGSLDLSVYINQKLIGVFNQGGDGSSDSTLDKVPQTPRGSVGFGAGQDQLCRFRNVTVKSIPAQEILYTSGLNNPSVLGDFGIGWNQFPYIFDGAKRDRYAWTADIIIGGPSLYYSTAGTEYIRGNIEASMLRSTAKDGELGLLPAGVPPGREFERPSSDTMFNILCVNYSLYLLTVLHDYWLYTGDDDFLSRYWDRVTGVLAFVETLVNDQGLVVAEGIMAADYDYYNGRQEGISTKRNVLYVAAIKNCVTMAESSAINDLALAKTLTARAERTSTAINQHLFNSDRQHYNITTKRTVGFQQETHAWVLLTDIVPTSHKQLLMEKFKTLYTGTHNHSPTQFTSDAEGIKPTISPITSAFHILAALSTDDVPSAEHILRSVWEPICDTSSPHFTGTTWEFLLPDGTPFEDQFCSYAQLFSVGPTFILSRFMLGIEPTAPGFKSFLVAPRFPVEGVTWAQGRCPTPSGEPIIVRWQFFDNGWKLWCKAPAGLTGRVVVPKVVLKRGKRLMVCGLERGLEQDIEINKDSRQNLDIEVLF